MSSQPQVNGLVTSTAPPGIAQASRIVMSTCFSPQVLQSRPSAASVLTAPA